MPEITVGPRRLDQILYPEHIIFAFHTLPDEGFGGNGLSTISKTFASCLMGEQSLMCQTGNELRRHYIDHVLNKKTQDYTDAGFDRWRKDIGLNHPESLRRLDKKLDNNVAKRAIELSNNYPVSVVDSKLFSWLQVIGKSLNHFPIITQATLISIGVWADENVSIQRVMNRESEHDNILTLEQARKLRIDRYQSDIHNINTVLYPIGNKIGWPFNSTTLTNISHFIIDNSAPSTKQEIEQFVQTAISTIIETVPILGPTLIKSLCSNRT